MSEEQYPYTVNTNGPVYPSKCLLNSEEKSAFKPKNHEYLYGKSVYDIVKAVSE